MRGADTELEVYAIHAYVDFDVLTDCQLTAFASAAHAVSDTTLPTDTAHGSKQFVAPSQYLEIATTWR